MKTTETMDGTSEEFARLKAEVQRLRSVVRKRKWEDSALRDIVQGVLATTGSQFFDALTTRLGDVLAVDHIFIGKLLDEGDDCVETLSTWNEGSLGENFEFNFTGTPCESVIGKKLCYYPTDTHKKFPMDHWLAEAGIESYIGIPLDNTHGEPIGVIAAMSKQRLGNPEMAVALLEIFAPRVAAELDRVKAEVSLRESEDRLARLFESAFDGLVIHQDDVIMCNKSAAEILGYSMTGLIGTSILDIFKTDSMSDLMSLSGERSHSAFETLCETRTGRSVYVEVVTNRTEYDGKPAYITAFRDITKRKLAEESISHLATHDALTDLPNRLLFYQRLEIESERAQALGDMIAIHFIDLDGFKTINDDHGHAAGDEVLKIVASRLREAVRTSDTVARLGGDEFAVIQAGVKEDAHAAALSTKMCQAVAEPISIGPHKVSVTASIGIGLFPRDTTDIEALVSKADMAMYQSKNTEGCAHTFC